MARAAARPGPPTLTLGVFGTGETDEQNVIALLDDFIEGQGEVRPRFVVPLSKTATTDTVAAVVAYAEGKGYEYDVVLVETPRTKALKEIAEGASKTVKVAEGDDDEAIGAALCQRLSEANDARLLFLWAEDADGPLEDEQRVLFVALDAGVVALDLTSGLDVLGAAEDGSGDDAPPEGGDAEVGGVAREEAAGWPIRKLRAWSLDKEVHGKSVLTPAKSGKMEADEILDHIFGPAGEAPSEGADEAPVDGPTREELEDWPVRRVRSYVKEVAASEREEKGDDAAPSDDELDDMDKVALIAWYFAEEAPAEAEAEVAPAEEVDSTVTPRRARQIREEAEAEAAAKSGGDYLSDVGTDPDARIAAEKWRAEHPEGEGTLVSRALVRQVLMAAAEEIADVMADKIIDRIAERVEAEPEGSAARKEIAPPRPPGRPPLSGSAPTRRRTAAR